MSHLKSISLGLALVATSLLLAVSASAQDTAVQSSITSTEAAAHVGEVQTVCGKIVGSAYLDQSKNKLTFLNMDGEHPNEPLTVVIEFENRAHFSEPPEVAYRGKDVCVTGTIELYHDKAQIKVSDPSMIKVTGGSDAAAE